MLSTKERIRPVAICIFKHENQILVCRASDKIKNETYYRPLGGGIEFQELSINSLRREIREELGHEIKNEKFLGTLENIFIMEGAPKHEIIFVYDAEFTDDSVYHNELVKITEAGWEGASWKSLDEFGPGKLILYPNGILELISEPLKLP